jgi:hypothetical protein
MTGMRPGDRVDVTLDCVIEERDGRQVARVFVRLVDAPAGEGGKRPPAPHPGARRNVVQRWFGVSNDQTLTAAFAIDLGAVETAPTADEVGQPAFSNEVNLPPWTHGTQLGREHRSVRQHLVEDHGVRQDQLDEWSDGAVHGHHDSVHSRTWAYAEDLPHPAPGDIRAW